MLGLFIRIRNRIVRLLIGFDAVKFNSIHSDLKQNIDEFNLLMINMKKSVADNAESVSEIKDLVNNSIEILSSDRDNISFLRHKLWDVRNTKEYDSVLSNKSPLISVRIATYNRPK